MLHGLLWFPLLLVFVLLAALGWLERRRQSLFRTWAEGAELMKLDGCGGAQLKDGRLQWCSFEAGRFQDQGDFDICRLELVELMALASGEAPSPMNPRAVVASGWSAKACRWMFPSPMLRGPRAGAMS